MTPPTAAPDARLLAAVADAIEAEFWALCDEDCRPPAWPGGGGQVRWKIQFRACASRAIEAGRLCREGNIAGEALERALAVALFIGFFEPKGDWYCTSPPRGFDALPPQQREVFHVLARATLAQARAWRKLAA